MKSGLFETNRLEAFSDGVIAIIITIMVIEFRPPTGNSFSDLAPMVPTFLAYILSFIFLAIYWNNHHHLLQAAKGVNGRIMWSNMGLLFFLTLVPFVTAWMGENHEALAPTAVYGVVLLGAAIAYYNLQLAIFATLGKNSPFVRAVGADYKGKLSPAIYILAIIFAFIMPVVSQILFVLVAIMWVVPDRRIERALR
ncbi:MAG: hypothetical protein JWO07_41 [Candidatus Saccharibacteria bacterium]|nr:hypothetical protein [Candidatus Saccharibacteria bacterium]